MFYTIETSCTSRDVIHDNLLISTFCFSFLLNTFYFSLFFTFNLPPKGREHKLRNAIFALVTYTKKLLPRATFPFLPNPQAKHHALAQDGSGRTASTSVTVLVVLTVIKTPAPVVQ